MTTERTKELVQGYYDSWKSGAARFDEQRLLAVLAPRVIFESPVSRREDAASLVEAIARFSKTLRGIRFLQTLTADDEAAVVYDCDLTSPTDTLRFGEFFRIEGDRIASIRLVFDPTAYRKPVNP